MKKNIDLTLLLILLFTLPACSTFSPLLTKNNYEDSLDAFYHGDLVDARDLHPSGERGAFITTMERAYLDLLQGRANIESLQKYATQIEDRVRYDVSREINSFFYLQTPEDYYASEHEIVWMHLLLSWGYSHNREYEKACVEARKASHLLSHSWSEEGHFDDPSLRILLGVMWAMCGNWEEAVVDFRAARKLDATLTWLDALSEQETPPQSLVIGLGGPGPEPVWNPEVNVNLFRSLRGIDFQFLGAQSNLEAIDRQNNAHKFYRSPGSYPWYQRHVQRDNEIHELIEDSRYGGKVMGRSVISGVEISTQTLVGAGWIIIGTAAGLGVAYLGLLAESTDLALLGLAIVGYNVHSAIDFISKRNRASLVRTEDKLDYSKHYRFVRYLPEYLWLSWSEDLFEPDISIERNGEWIASLGKPVVSHKGNQVFLFYHPDIYYLRR